jgi:hypothetical protein
MADVNELCPLVWSISSLPETIGITRFKLPYEAQASLARWSREKGVRDELSMRIILRGLSEIMAWFVPEIAFMKDEREATDDGPRLCIYLAGHTETSPDVRNRMQAGLAMWLGIAFSDKNPQVRRVIAGSPLDDSNWRYINVLTQLCVNDGACVVPTDPMLWNAISLIAVEAVAGKAVKFQSGEQRTLLRASAQPSLYSGIELVAFPPKQSPTKEGLWSEVITISAANFPERSEICVLARTSIRNWGAITHYKGSNERGRSLDIFIPPGAAISARPLHRHSSFDFRVKVDFTSSSGQDGQRRLIACWQCDETQRLADLLRRLTGRKPLNDASLLSPVIDEDGLWLLPRLGSGHGDRFLSGGTGLPWPDRRDIAESLDSAFATIGAKRAEAMNRALRARIPMDRPFSARMKTEDARPLRRAALRTTLHALGNEKGHLDFYVFHRMERTPQHVMDHVREFLGQPDRENGLQLCWKDGISVRICPCPAGPLSEMLPRAELTDAEKEGRSTRLQKELVRAKQDEHNKNSRRLMTEHIRRATGTKTEIACAILEMPSELKTNPWRDPYAMSRCELARQRVVTQVILIDDEVPEEKYLASLQDCFRMLGVPPIEEIEGLDYRPSAMTVIQRNEAVVGGGSIGGQAFPLAARIRNNVLECALPEESGEPKWMPYAYAALRIFSGEYGRFSRNRQEENQAKFRTFFASVLEQIDKCGPTVIIAEMETAKRLPALQNKNLIFDQLQLGNERYVPSDLTNTRIVRTSPDPDKQPHYYHETGAKWPSGIFTWGKAQRTAYALKTKPPSVSRKSSFASQTSRHPAATDNQQRSATDAARLTAQLDEICIAFMQPGDDPMKLISFVHLLRGTHPQYKYETSKPYPLHELRLLGGSITS